MKIMKTKALLRALVIPVGFLLAGGVGAADKVTITGLDPSHPFGGGPFTATPVEGGPLTVGESFTTFCLERNETISLGGTYFYQLSTTVIDRNTGSPIALDFDTAYLYSAFRGGTLGSGFNGTTTHLEELQEAIYATEGILGTDGPANGLAALLVAEAALANWSDYGNVRVMNLGSADDGQWNRQDQLAIVPIPAAAWLFGTGLFGLAVIRRRKSA